MKKTNKLISILLVLAMLLSMAPLSLTASAADIEVYATGTLGSGSRTAWTIYDNGLLVIDGKGNSVSTKWDSTTASPWKDYADIITRVSFVNCENWECIPECTFRSLSKLKDVTLPENIEEICQYAFTGTAIETILLPDGLITIGYYAFSSCESLKYININDGVTSIGSSAFYNCSSLKAISIPDSVTSIGQTLFQNCTNLEYVRLSENADKVGGSMFSGCTMLKNVSLPASVTVIGSKAFSNASNLEGVYYHGFNEPTTYNPGINNATFSLAPDTMVIYASNDYSATTMGLKANWENDVQTVTKIEGHFVNIAHTANGAVKVGASIVPAGDTVTIDIMAYKNYELDTITVTDSNGQVELSGSGHSRTFSMPEGDVRISATFKSTATPHVHSWTYAANGATITATCAYADTCHNPISKVEISKGNTSSLTFRPDNAKYMTVSGTMEDVVIPDLVYTLKSTGEPTTPINPGVYVASLTIENVTATYEFEITRGNFNYTYFTYTAPQNLTYDGTPKYASVVMSEDYVPYAGEYTVYYNSGTTEPINAGTYTVKVNVAESDYFTAGTALSGRAWRFTIAPKSIEDLTYEGLGTSYPVGATPDVTIKHGDMVLVKDTDYTVEYANNTELGTATMTVTGVGNYTGSKTLEFEIVPHTHSFTYSASGDTITAVCENTDGNCPDSEGTLTILAPADLYADGITAKEATVENNLVDTSVAISEITYSAPYGLPPKDAGTYTASVTVGGATATVEFTLLNYAAKVTDKDGNKLSGSPYKTFAEAVTAASASEGSILTLLDDVTLTEEQNIHSGEFTLDLNGKNLINENGRVLYIFEEADLTIKDSGETGTLEIMNTASYAICNYGTLTVESGNIKGAGGIDNKGTLTFKDGTVETVTYSAIDNTGTAYVYDGVLKHAKSLALGNYGTLYVYDGEIDGVSNNGTAYISGGEIDCDNYAALNLLGGKLEVTGGSFTGTDLASGYYSGTPYGEWTVYYGEDATLTLKGGEFPNGFVVANTTANTFLAEDYAFYDKDGNKITVADDAKIIDGYVQVKERFAASVTDKDGNELEGSPYKTLADAITAASASEDSTLTLLDDITLTETAIISSGKFILDLNGKTILNKTDDVLMVYYHANITIKDSCEGGTVQTNGATSQTIFNCGTLTIENGLFKGAAGIVTSGTLNFKNGKIEADTYDAIRNSGTVYIYNGSFTSIDAGAINVDTDGTAYIYGGEFSGFCGISNSGTAYIEGGEFKGNSYAAFNLYSGTVEVTGGSFTGTDFASGYYSGTPYGEWTVYYGEDTTLTLKGGEFPNGFVTDETTAITFLAEGYAFYDKDGNKITVADDATKIEGYVQVKERFVASVTDKDGNELEGSPYKTFADAITAASASEDSTLTLLDDITLTETARISSGKFILDLNGKNLINENGRVLYIYEEADLTIKDSGEGGTVETKHMYTKCIDNSGKLTVESGIIKGDGGIDNYGVLYFNEGTVEADNYGAITNYSDSTVYVYNGVLKSSNSGAVENSGTLYVYDGEIKGITNSNTVYISGGTIDRDDYAALNLLGGTLEVTGGSFTGGEWTVCCTEGAALILKGGEFPNGFVAYEATANAFLAEDYYYKDADGKLIDVADDAKIINGYVKVSKGADLSEAVITLDETQFTYSGTEHKPTVIVTVGGKTLTEGKDYTLTFANNVNAGIATVTVRGIGQAAGGIAGGGEDIGNSSNSGDITESIYTGKIIKNFTIKPATVDIIWEGDSFYFTGNPHKVTAKYVDVNGDENPAAITQNKTNTEVGNYIATATVDDYNYTANSATAKHAYEIKWYDGAPDATVSGEKGENGWYTSEVTVTAPEGYAISTLADGIYGSEVIFGNEEKAVYYLKQTENGYIAKVELGEIKCDLADPAAEIVIDEYKWTSSATAISFGLFFKETKAFSISASDSESGIAKAEYFVATEKITDFGNIEWIEYTGAVSISPNSKNIIYAKVTDNSGRYVIVNSDGIVLYTDSTLDTTFKDEIVYVLTKNASQSFNLNLNGNTVAYVKIGETVLGTEDYEVLGNMIIVSSDVLENLAAGNYAITVGVNPLGEAYVDGDAPAEVIIPLTVKKADVTIEISDFGKVYDGKPVTADYKISKSSDSSPAVSNIDYNETVEFKAYGADDSTYTTDVPVNAGEYTVRITVAETDKINSAEATADFTIEKKFVTATATAPDKVYDGTVNLDFSKVVITFDGIADGDDVSYEIMGGAYVNSNVAEKVIVAVSYDVSGKDVSNYEFRSGATIPEAKYYSVMTFASILAKDISDGFIILGEPLTYNGTEQTQTVEKVLPTGTAPEATYTVSGNKATNVGVYLLTVTGTGNFTGEAKIAYEIAVDDDCISHLDRVEDNGVMKWNVKSTDRESLEYVVDQLNNAVTDLADSDKKEEWAGIKEGCEDMLRIINSVELFIADVEEDYAEFDIETVKSSDVPALDELVSKVNEIKDRYGFNLTDEEAQKLEDILDGVEKLKAKIDETAKEIERIENTVGGYNEETVKSSDEEAINKLKEDIQSLIDSGNVTEEEIAGLEEIKTDADALTDKIDETQTEIDRINDAVAGYDEESIKSTDKEAINKLKDDIQALIDSGNVTEEEIAGLEEIKTDADALTDKITETEEKLEEIKGIENNYNPETVSSEDKAAIEDKIAEIEEVNPDNLTDEQKAEYDEIKAGFEALLEEIAAAEKAVADIGAELEMFDEERVTIFWEDDIEALKAKIDELLADENMGEAEKAKLNEYKAQAEKLIEIINTPVKYLSLRFFYFIWDSLHWLSSRVIFIFNWIVAMF